MNGSGVARGSIFQKVPCLKRVASAGPFLIRRSRFGGNVEAIGQTTTAVSKRPYNNHK